MKFLDDTSIFVGYNPQMMPPPMGPNQGNYGPSGGKMSGNMPGPMNQGYPQYNSHYPQGKYILYKKNHLKLLLLFKSNVDQSYNILQLIQEGEFN